MKNMVLTKDGYIIELTINELSIIRYLLEIAKKREDTPERLKEYSDLFEKLNPRNAFNNGN